jgi:hypothetical protein
MHWQPTRRALDRSRLEHRSFSWLSRGEGFSWRITATIIRLTRIPMKSFQVLSAGCALFAATLLQASSSGRAQILSERDATLSRIVMILEERQRVGAADETALFTARLALATFRRDVAPTATQKIAQQKALVALREERVTNLKARLATGLSEEVELLCATDELLAAKQALLDLTAVAMEG